MVLNLIDKFCAKPRKCPSIPARWRQEECHKRNPFIGHRKVNSLLCDKRSEPKAFSLENQSIIPLIALFLKTAPSDIAVITKYCPMAKPITAPTLLFCSNEFGGSDVIPIACEERHVLSNARV